MNNNTSKQLIGSFSADPYIILCLRDNDKTYLSHIDANTNSSYEYLNNLTHLILKFI